MKDKETSAPVMGLYKVKLKLPLSLLLLFCISFFYFTFFGKGNIFYQENRFLFIFSGDYLYSFLAKPGGLLTWCGNFLMQFYFNIIFASFINSFLVIVFSLLLIRVLKELRIEGPVKLPAVLLPSAFLLFLQAHYDYHLQHSLGMIFSILFFLLIISQNGKEKITIYALYPPVCMILGSYAFVSAMMYMIYCIFYKSGKERFIEALVLPVYSSLIILIFQNLIFFQTFKVLLGNPLLYNETALLTNSLIVFALVTILYPALVKYSAFAFKERAGIWIESVIIFSVFSVTILILLKQNDPVLSGVFRIEKYYHDGDREKVIREYENGDYHNIVAEYFYNLALSGKGELCNRMFYGPQSYGPLSLSLEGRKNQVSRTMYFYYSTGLVNEAHHLAYEQMVQQGFTPENIKMLIKTELIRGNYKPAARYIDVLMKTHYRKWALKYKEMTGQPRLISSDPELAEKIRLLPQSDFFVSTDDSRNLALLLKSNPQNKTAFEYLVARLLLEKDIIGVTEQVKRMKDIGYGSIPRHIEEAVVAYNAYSGKSADTGGLSVSAETAGRFRQYGSFISRTGGNKNMVRQSIKKSEKNTFWYYLQYNTISSDFFRPQISDKTVN